MMFVLVYTQKKDEFFTGSLHYNGELLAEVSSTVSTRIPTGQFIMKARVANDDRIEFEIPEVGRKITSGGNPAHVTAFGTTIVHVEDTNGFHWYVPANVYDAIRKVRERTRVKVDDEYMLVCVDVRQLF